MSFYEEQIVSRLVDLAGRDPALQDWRARAMEGLAGTVVEVGFGSGTNLPVYPDEVAVVYAVEPSEVARRRSQDRHGHPGLTVHHVGRDGQELPLADDSCDGALSTFTLCTIPRVEDALAEVRRVVRAGGRFNFLEHGRSPDERVRRWQHRLEPVQRRLVGGCHLTRDVTSMVSDAGFRIDRVSSRYLHGPTPWTWLTVGSALVPPGAGRRPGG